MKVIPVPQLEDNYAYLLVDEKSGHAAAVDPVQPEKVLQAASKNGVDVKMTLITHHHWDHAGGTEQLKSMRPDIPIISGDERVKGFDKLVKHGDKLEFGSFDIDCLHTPCHTMGSISYYCTEDNEKLVFTGDTLFIGKLPGETKVYCGHEYTKSNLKFAAHVEPNNADILDKIKWCESHPVTIPSTIGEQWKINPFMRVGELSVKSFLKLSEQDKEDPVKVMGELRRMKDHFR
ncbi:beta-lactamase-like protein [Paraphysoderma sedebokerense]|nr:beta-lactamase-like protein [Paraphysoderma sedebokerense]